MNFEKYKQWSLLDPKPIVFYNENIQEWYVYWNGVFMLYDAALLVAGVTLLHSPPSKEMVAICNHKFKMMLNSGIFGPISNVAWYDIANDGVISYYNKALRTHIHHNLARYPKIEVFKWFMKRYD